MPEFNVTDVNGNPVTRGDTLTDFRGDTALFHSVERGPMPGKSAKVIVDVSDGVHAESLRTYYASVFDLNVTEV